MDKTMKALVLTGVGKLEVQERPIPCMTPSAGDEVLVRVKACGVCGTDLHIFHGDEGSAKSTLPIILGHEFAGEVAEVGKGVKSLRPGDRVAVDPNCACGICYYCRSGKPHYCSNMLCYGTALDGAFAEYCLVKEKVCYLLPGSIGYSAAAMVEPVACCLHGIDLCGIEPGQSVLVIGCGPIGQIMVQLAKAAGAAGIAVIEPVAAKREIALKYGASIALDPNEFNGIPNAPDTADAPGSPDTAGAAGIAGIAGTADIAGIAGAAGTAGIAGALASNGFHDINTVIECVGNTRTMRQAISLAGYASTVMLFGLSSPRDELTINPFADLFRKEIKLTASFINPLTCSRSIALLSSGRIVTDALVTDRLPIEKAAEAFTDDAYRARGKIQIVF